MKNVIEPEDGKRLSQSILTGDKKELRKVCDKLDVNISDLMNDSHKEEFVSLRKVVTFQLKKNGWGTARIARALGVKFGTIKNYLKEWGKK